MQVEIEKVSSLERRVKIGVAQDKMRSAISKKVNEIAKKASIKGFREGKVPASVIEKKYGESIKTEVLDDIINAQVKELIDKEKIKLARNPKLEEMKDEAGQDVECVLSLEVLPEVELKPFDELNLTTYKSNPSDSEVQEYIENIKTAYPVREKVERESKENDVVSVDLDITFADEELNNSIKDKTAKDFQVKLNGTYEFKEIEEGLHKVKAGDTKEVKMVYPENFSNASLAGKEATFKMNVVSVFEEQAPELNFDLLKKVFNIKEDESAITDINARFAEEAKKKVCEEVDTECKYFYSEKVLENLNDAYDFEIPESMMQQEIQQVKYEREYDKAMGQEVAELSEDELKAEAKKRAKLGIVLSEIVEKEGIKLDKETVNANLQEAISVIMKTNPMILSALNGQDENTRQAAEDMVRKQILVMKVIEHVLSKAKVEEKLLTVEEAKKLLAEKA